MQSMLRLVIPAFFILALGYLISQQASYQLIAAAAVPVIFIACFINPGIGLYLIIFSMLLSPEFVVGDTRGATLGRGVTLRAEDFLLMIIAASWFFKAAIDKDLGLFYKTPLNKPILFYALACLVATGLGVIGGRVEAKTGFFFVLKYIEYFIVFFMVANYVRTEKQLKGFVFCLFLTCFIVSVVGIGQIAEGVRVSAPFEGEAGEPNTFGGYLVFIMAIAIGVFYHVKDIKTRQLLLLLMVFIIPPFLFTQSRASYLAFIPMLFALGMMMRQRVIVTGMIAAVLILSPLFLPATVMDRVLFTFTQPEARGQIQVGEVKLDTSLSARLSSYQKAITEWPQHPVFGYGVTGHRFLDGQYFRVLVETGLVGLIAFIVLLAAVFKMAVTHYQQVTTPFAKGICMGYIAGFIGLIFHGLGANTFIIVRIMMPFWFFTGLVFVLPMVEQAFQTAEENQANSSGALQRLMHS